MPVPTSTLNLKLSIPTDGATCRRTDTCVYPYYSQSLHSKLLSFLSFLIAMAGKTHNIGVISYGLSANIFQTPYIPADPALSFGPLHKDQGKKPPKTIQTASFTGLQNTCRRMAPSTELCWHLSVVSAALHAGKHGNFESHCLIVM